MFKNKFTLGFLVAMFAFSAAVAQPAKVQAQQSTGTNSDSLGDVSPPVGPPPGVPTTNSYSTNDSFSISQSSTDGSPVFVTTGASPEELMTIIESLRAQIASLQEQISQARGEINQILQSGLSQGMQNEDIRQIQELLATNPAIYPEGLVTGYFGTLTDSAIQRFQGSHSLSVTGEVDDETKEYLEEYMKEKMSSFGDVNSLWGRERMEEIRARIQERREKMRERMDERREEMRERMEENRERLNERRANNEPRWDDRLSRVSKRIALSALRDVSKDVLVAENALDRFEDDDQYDDDDLEKAGKYLDAAKEHLEKTREYYLDGNYSKTRFEAGKTRVDARAVIRELRKLDRDMVEEAEDEVEDEFDEDEFEEDLEEDEEDENEMNIVETAIDNDDFNTLVAAVTAADLVDTLSGTGPFTVFAPVDAAFADLPDGTLDDLLLPENKDELAGILTYHVVSGEVASTDLTDGMTVSTVNGAEVTIGVSSSGVTVNDANVVIADIQTSNGIIHVIDAVLLPPTE